jgi:hypothetical protein
MDKRVFFKKSGAIMAASILPRFSPVDRQSAPRENWPGNITHGTDRVFTPVSIDDGYKRYEAIRPTPGPWPTPLHQQHRREQCEPDLAASMLAVCE